MMRVAEAIMRSAAFRATYETLLCLAGGPPRAKQDLPGLPDGPGRTERDSDHASDERHAGQQHGPVTL